MNAPQARHIDANGLTRPPARGLAVRLVLNAAVPLLVYLLVRPQVHSDLSALVIGAAVPAAYTVAVLLWRRRLDPVGAVAVGCFSIGVLLAIASGGNTLVFKLREDLWSGPLGLACLISVAVRRPLFLLALRLAARRNTEAAQRLGNPRARRITTVSTAVIGALLLVHALTMVALATTTSTTTFLAVSRPVSWAMIAGGLAGLVWWIRHDAGHTDQRTLEHTDTRPR